MSIALVAGMIPLASVPASAAISVVASDDHHDDDHHDDDHHDDDREGPSGGSYQYKVETSLVWRDTATVGDENFTSLATVAGCATHAPLWQQQNVFDGNTYTYGVTSDSIRTVVKRLKVDSDNDGYNDYDHNRDGYDDRDRDRDGHLDTDKDRDGYSDHDKNRDGYDDHDHNRDGWRDDDHDHDGYSDYDHNRDGYSDYDKDRDGHLDTDHDRDGYDDHDHNRDGWRDDDHDRDGYSDYDKDRDGWDDRDRDRDGHLDCDKDRDGYSDHDKNRDGWIDDDKDRDGRPDNSADTWEEYYANPYKNETVGRICHAANAAKNPYQNIGPSSAGIINGHMKHTGPVFKIGMKSGSNWGDIIPPMPEAGIAGLNWTEEGQAIWAADCDPYDVVQPAPEPTVEPVVEPEWEIVSDTTVVNHTCDTFNTPTAKAKPLPLVGQFRVNGPFDHTGTPMISSADGGTMTRTPANDGVIDWRGVASGGVSSLGNAMLNRLGTTDPAVLASETPTAAEAYQYGWVDSNGTAFTDSTTEDELLDHGRYIGLGNTYSSVVNYINFDTFPADLMPKLYPSVLTSENYFTSTGISPVYIDGFDSNQAAHTTSRFKVTCQTNTAKGMLYYEPVTGPNDQNVVTGVWEDDADTYAYECGDSSPRFRTSDIMTCGIDGTYGPGTRMVDGKAAAPVATVRGANGITEDNVYSVHSFADPYGVQWAPVEIIINSGEQAGMSVDELGPDANVTWERNWDLTDDSSPILLHDQDPNATVDRNYALQPYHVFMDDDLSSAPSVDEKWTPLADDGTTYDASVERWVGGKDREWMDTQQGMWVRFYQSSTSGSGWTVVPRYRVTATLPMEVDYISGLNVDAGGNITGVTSETGVKDLRQSYSCPAAPVTFDVSRVS